MAKYTVQVLPSAHGLFIVPVEEGDKELYFTGASGFYDLTGEQHGSFFEDAETLLHYIEKIEEVGFDEKLADPFDVLPLQDYEMCMDEDEINKGRGVSPETQAKALEIKKNYMGT